MCSAVQTQSLPDRLWLMKDAQENWHSPSHRLPDKTSAKVNQISLCGWCHKQEVYVGHGMMIPV